ncbi:hypothetical protein GA0070616_2722 [Micromonospora nigra]|uniref:Uncharacterized protein n=1 Tax=Micromonospora nigra TaxID=145857 RepID=A0A1C6S1U6_9ACTN|nr:hypothetical protein [Micromonospora nigra]SCL23420.1 hypothetical protein GA0070616_2722 [Micromonospora nigra]
MSTAKRPATARPDKPAKATGWVVGLSIGAVVLAILIGVLAGDDNDSTFVPPPTATERADTVPILARAAQSQGLCYGWRLVDRGGLDALSVGSNLGDGVPVTDNPGCPRWIQVVAEIRYTSESSELEDSVLVDVEGSTDIDAIALIRVENGLERFGLTEEAFLDDPGWAITRAAVSLPLLYAETGAVEPAPAVTATPTASVAPLPDTSSDLWRDRWGYLVGAVVLLLITVLLVTVGLVQRRRQRAAAGTRPRGPAARAGGPERTPERR